jgi:hypothetical protein
VAQVEYMYLATCRSFPCPLKDFPPSRHLFSYNETILQVLGTLSSYDIVPEVSEFVVQNSDAKKSAVALTLCEFARLSEDYVEMA